MPILEYGHPGAHIYWHLIPGAIHQSSLRGAHKLLLLYRHLNGSCKIIKAAGQYDAPANLDIRKRQWLLRLISIVANYVGGSKEPLREQNTCCTGSDVTRVTSLSYWATSLPV